MYLYRFENKDKRAEQIGLLCPLHGTFIEFRIHHVDFCFMIFRSWSGSCIVLNAKLCQGLTRTRDNLLHLPYV